jgi:DNA-binding transcriptional ArsR family regulator
MVAVMRTSPTSVDLDVLGRVGRALADETRRRILVRLTESAAYPSDLAEELGSTRANVSNHLTCLRGCGLVVAQPEGRRVRYELVDRRLGRALRDLLGLVVVPDPASCPASADDGRC